MITRRKLLKSAAATGLATTASGLALPAYAKATPIKIGFVTPQTGPLAIFAEPDQFTIDQFKAQIGDGIEIDGTVHPVEFIVKDSQSSSNRASSARCACARRRSRIPRSNLQTLVISEGPAGGRSLGVSDAG